MKTYKIDTERGLELVDLIRQSRCNHHAEIDRLETRFQAEKKEIAEAGQRDFDRLFKLLSEEVGMPPDSSKQNLRLDAEYVDEHRVAFLKYGAEEENEDNPLKGLAELLGIRRAAGHG